MTNETTYYTTQDKAQEYGKTFQTSWGYGYGPTFCVWYHAESDSWACLTYRYDSCD